MAEHHESFNEDKFKLWIEYEKIAMHFNGLIMQLRARALAGIGLVTTFSAIFINTDDSQGLNWGFLAVLSILLTLAWTAVFIIDYFYYHRLLRGAVAAIIELEDSTALQITKIQMSSKIKEEANNSNRYMLLFYGAVYLLLCVLFFLFTTYERHPFYLRMFSLNK